MTIEEIESTLPNGFHDAQIKSININYVERVVTFHLDVWIADAIEEDPETYQEVQLTLSRFLYCVIEAPDSQYPYQEKKMLWVDAGSAISTEGSSTQLPKSLPEGAFAYWFFVNNWNAFIHIAAMDAHLSYVGVAP